MQGFFFVRQQSMQGFDAAFSPSHPHSLMLQEMERTFLHFRFFLFREQWEPLNVLIYTQKFLLTCIHGCTSNFA